MTTRPMWETDPDAYRAYLADGNARQPRKRVAADAIVRDPAGRILVVDPTYKPAWDLPGGMIEANEPPRAGLRRELVEELGLTVERADLAVVEWQAPTDPWDDLIAMVFDCGSVAANVAEALAPVDTELAAIRWVTLAEAADLLRPDIWRRAELIVTRPGQVHYLEP